MIKIINFVSFFCLLVCSISSPAQLVGGNGGTGVLTADGRVLLYDLIEYNNQNSMFVGSMMHQEIVEHQNLLISLSEAIPFQRNLLIRKLSDLQAISPHLGLYVMQVMALYNWRMSSDNLPVIHEGDVDLPAGARRVQLAIRYGNLITVQKKLWQKMTPEHQVGLLIHEALFAMVRPTCTGEFVQTCRQPVEIIWKMVADFFRPVFLVHELGVDEQLILNLPFIADGEDIDAMSVRFVKTVNSKTMILGHAKDYVDMNLKFRREQAVHMVCTDAERAGLFGKENISLKIDAIRTPYILTYHSYCADFGAQLGVHFARRSGKISLEVSFQSYEECSKRLNEHLSEKVFSQIIPLIGPVTLDPQVCL